MTIIAEVPAAIMQMAAQFAHPDLYKGGITGIHLHSQKKSLRIAATNGHFAFRCTVPFGDNCFINQEELLVPASTFKKKVAYARKVSIVDGEARFCGGKKDTMTLLEARPCIAPLPPEGWIFPSHFDSLWPAPETMENKPGGFIAFDAAYMRTICDVVAKCPEASRLHWFTGNSTTTAMLLTAEDDGLLLEFLLLPVMVRRD